MQNYIVYMQFIIQMGDLFTVLGLFSLNISYGLSIANGGHYRL